MISLDIVDTDAFLDMPTSSQLLYFHLSARADDDGFVSSPKKVSRMIGVNDDDLKVLVTKKFIIPFDSGVCVIKHWRINNFVRKDIYKETKYTELKAQLFIKENGAYTVNNDDAIPVPNGHFRLSDIHVNVPSTLRQPRLGKVSIGKVSIGKVSIESSNTHKIKSFFNKESEYENIVSLMSEKIPNHLVVRELDKFILYWTEPNKSGTKVRWQLQNTFEVKRRIKTWFDRISDKTKTKGKGIIL